MGQPESYWGGGYDQHREANPVGGFLLAGHPVWFIVMSVLYALLFTALIAWLPRVLAWWLSIALLLAHIGGAKTWLPLFVSWSQYSMYEGTLNGVVSAWVVLLLFRAFRVGNRSTSG